MKKVIISISLNINIFVLFIIKSFDLQKENLNDRDEFKLEKNDIVLI